MKLAFKIIHGHQTTHYLEGGDFSTDVHMWLSSDYHEVEVEREVAARHVYAYRVCVGNTVVAEFNVGTDTMGLEIGRVFPSFAIRNMIYRELVRIHG